MCTSSLNFFNSVIASHYHNWIRNVTNLLKILNYCLMYILFRNDDCMKSYLFFFRCMMEGSQLSAFFRLDKTSKGPWC